MNCNIYILAAALTLYLQTCSCDGDCNVTNHSDEESDAFNVCFNNSEVQLLTCSGDKRLVITDVVQRIKSKRCSTTEDCCRVKDSDLFEKTRNCKISNPTLTALLTEIISKCNGRKFCYFLEPKSSIWPFIQEGKHPTASHLRISFKCDNWPRYEMCENISREVTVPFYISTSSQNHSNCSCDIYTKDPARFFLSVMEVTLGSNLGNSFTIKNSTYKETFTGGRDELVLNRKFGSWSKVMVILETNKQRTTADVLVEVKGNAKKVQLKCHGVKQEYGPIAIAPPEIEVKNNDISMFAWGFLAACVSISLFIAGIAIRKRKASCDTALTYITPTHEETGNETVSVSDLGGYANDVVRQGTSRQNGDANAEIDVRYENLEHIYSQAI